MIFTHDRRRMSARLMDGCGSQGAVEMKIEMTGPEVTVATTKELIAAMKMQPRPVRILSKGGIYESPDQVGK